MPPPSAPVVTATDVRTAPDGVIEARMLCSCDAPSGQFLQRGFLSEHDAEEAARRMMARHLREHHPAELRRRQTDQKG